MTDSQHLRNGELKSVPPPSDPNSIEIGELPLQTLDHFAAVMVRNLPSPLVFGLVGTLGAGKTTLVQSFARATGFDPSEVTSPTFTLLQTYHGKITLHHLDAYRLSNEDEFLELGVDELFEEPGCWTLVEWADRVNDVLPAETVWILISSGSSDQTRRFTLRCSDPELRQRLQQVSEQMNSA